MKNHIILIFILMGLVLMSSGQTIDLTFTAVDNESYIQLDSIKVMNRTQGGDTVLYWPDTVLNLIVVGLDKPQLEESAFQVFQNYPNPVVDHTLISFYIPSKGAVSFMITDMMGRVIVKDDRMLNKGTHSLRFTPGEGKVYFFTARWHGISRCIKIIENTRHTDRHTSLEYIGGDATSPEMKEIVVKQGFSFNIGDELLYIGYTGTMQAGMFDAPEESQTYSLQFATNIPCPGTPTVEYGGQVYNTIQIFSQCWLKENMNAGMMIDGNDEMTDNDLIEKYCYNNNPGNCNSYGGLYQWHEAMQYTDTPGTQGICPPGWHLPTDEDWKLLEGAVDSHYNYPDPEWDIIGYRGFDAALNLKSTYGWASGGNGADLFDFTALAGGWKPSYGNFSDLGYVGHFWSSTENYTDNAWRRGLSGAYDASARGSDDGPTAFSVRCLKDQ